jgi:hypothetical protein
LLQAYANAEIAWLVVGDEFAGELAPVTAAEFVEVVVEVARAF